MLDHRYVIAFNNYKIQTAITIFLCQYSLWTVNQDVGSTVQKNPENKATLFSLYDLVNIAIECWKYM